MITLTLILMKTFPGIAFYQSLLAGLFIDLTLVLFMFYVMEKRKNAMEIKHAAVLDKYKKDQRQLEYKLKSYKGMMESVRQPDVSMDDLAKKQQEHEKILAQYVKNQENQLKEIETYKYKVQDYEKKLAQVNSPAPVRPIKNLEPLPPEVQR